MEPVTLIFGSSGQLGSAIAELDVNEGHTVFGLDSRSPIDFLNKSNLFTHLPIDLLDPVHVKQSVDNLFQSGDLYISSLVLAAAIDSVPTKVHLNDQSKLPNDMSFDEIQRRITINITSQIHTLDICQPYLRKSSHSLLFSSIYGVRSPDHRIYSNSFRKPLEYSASKSAILGIVKHFSVTAAADNKGRCNCLILGGVSSSSQDPNFQENYIHHVPLGRMAKRQDVVNAYKFLRSDLASYITGTSLVVDGGYTCL